MLKAVDLYLKFVINKNVFYNEKSNSSEYLYFPS